MRKLGFPTLFANDLVVEASGRVSGYRLRMPDQKRQSVEHVRALAFQVIAAGDSYNDTSMLAAAHAGILFRPPANVIAEFPQFPVTQDYDELERAFENAARLIATAET
jgi:phosphoserine/homoserine phosphotransferase